MPACFAPRLGTIPDPCPPQTFLTSLFSPPVAFKVYDLGNTGTIDHNEISALLIAMLKENPALKLPESVLEKIVDQARFYVCSGTLFPALCTETERSETSDVVCERRHAA